MNIPPGMPWRWRIKDMRRQQVSNSVISTSSFHLLLIIFISSTNCLSSLTDSEQIDHQDPLEEHPTTEKVQGWDSDELLKWIQKTQPKLLRVEKNFTRFKDAEISGKIFLKKADDAKFFRNECYLPPGPSEELADLASEIRGGITQGKLLSFIPYSKH
jgi:hypothetical protein